MIVDEIARETIWRWLRREATMRLGVALKLMIEFQPQTEKAVRRCRHIALRWR